MEHVDLNRLFLPIKKDEELNFEVARAWGKRIGGWLDWSDLLKKERVILLAEASSGKTAEFQNQTKKLLSERRAAFFLRIEELADEGFEQSLDPNAASVFQKWKNGFEDAYFFLDSVDEARLNRKRFDTALKKLAQGLSYSLERSRIFISCRPQDWKGAEDERIVKQLLPVCSNIPQHSVSDPETALLDTIFSDRKTENEDDKKNEPPSSDFTLVSLAPLDEEQQSKLAQEVGVADISEFSRSIWKNGLDRLAERPGDLIELAEYWKSYGKFGSLSEMTNHMVDQKLSEHDPYRPDNAEDYLKTQPRRHGILFMTDHGRRRWKHPLSRKKISFAELLGFLSEVANATTINSTGKIKVSVFGIDATG